MAFYIPPPLSVHICPWVSLCSFQLGPACNGSRNFIHHITTLPHWHRLYRFRENSEAILFCKRADRGSQHVPHLEAYIRVFVDVCLYSNHRQFLEHRLISSPSLLMDFKENRKFCFHSERISESPLTAFGRLYRA